MIEKSDKPFIPINGVHLTVDDLPEGKARGIFGRLQRLSQKKAQLVLDLEELQAGMNWFTNRLVELVNNEGADPEEPDDSNV
tara:strand:+ start:699 stop:944 length:246 start_codon:yes stop_codon:yes gene_type:complete